MFRNCKTCNARSETPDFHGYDRVTLEYVFGDEDGDFGFPFYVFYKRTGDGNEYIKTMVPAVAVFGMDDFFKLQRAEMNPLARVEFQLLNTQHRACRRHALFASAGR